MTPRLTQEESLAARPLLCVVGARPNYMKMAPLLAALHAQGLPTVLVHTGQHYDEDMKDTLFRALGLPTPDVALSLAARTPVQQTAEIMLQFDPLIDRYRPRAVVVVGDVTSTLACALVAAKRRVPLVHVEAGLRSFDRTMPEEQNRVLTDQLADVLYTTEPSGAVNLAHEGIEPARIVPVGNVMIDALLGHLPHAVAPREVLRAADADTRVLDDAVGYALVTAHRPSNVDHPEALSVLLSVLREVSMRLPVIFPMHPRTRKKIEQFDFNAYLDTPRIVCLPPLGYLEMLGVMAHARVVLTDSGGVQEETTALGVPCLTVRDNTERPITVEQGTNTLVGRDRLRILHSISAVLAGGGKRGRRPALWDGHAAARIAQHLNGWLASHQP